VLASGGAVSKAYATGMQALVMLLAVPLYAKLARRADPRRLVIGITLTVVVLLEVFAWLSSVRHPSVGFGFFVPVGIIGVLFVSQFWSFANDLVSEERGERIFPLVAVGMTAGSYAGSTLAKHLFQTGIGVPMLMRIAAGIFVVHALAYALIDRRASREETPTSRPSIAPSEDGLRLVMQSPYLKLFALVIILMSLVNTNGEFMLARAIESQAPGGPREAREAAIGAAYGEFYGNVNLLAIFLQAFVASRLARYGGVRATLLILPVVSLTTPLCAAFALPFAALALSKTVENACDYSITNTARALLWLPTSRDEKYKAKMTIDTFVVRTGDLLSTGVVHVVLVFFGFSLASFAWLTFSFGLVTIYLVHRLLVHRTTLTHRA
jgi:AAA family ATP:ADP antiporter